MTASELEIRPEWITAVALTLGCTQVEGGCNCRFTLDAIDAIATVLPLIRDRQDARNRAMARADEIRRKAVAALEALPVHGNPLPNHHCGACDARVILEEAIRL